MRKETIKDKLSQYLFLIVYYLRIKIIPRIDLNINKFIYQIQEKLDPLPAKKTKETDMDWYKRIDIKYSLRHAKFFYIYSKFVYLQFSQKIKLGLLDNLPKKLKREHVDLMNKMYEISQGCEEKYNMMLTRKRLEDSV